MTKQTSKFISLVVWLFLSLVAAAILLGVDIALNDISSWTRCVSVYVGAVFVLCILMLISVFISD